MRSSSSLQPGDWVVYLMQKSSASPGPRARDVRPAQGGDAYYYIVEKYWVVQEVLDDGRIRLRTRRGKEHIVTPRNPLLRRARWWERWLLGSRFRAVEHSPDAAAGEPPA
jgi:hypothetical protein